MSNCLQAAHICDLTPKTFHVLGGSALALLPSLAIGSSGGILALGLICAREFCDVYALAKGGRWDEAREIAARMMLADRGIPGRYGIGGLKAALDLQGLYGGRRRAPPRAPPRGAVEEHKENLPTAGRPQEGAAGGQA